MQLIHQTVTAVLVTPTEEYEGREYFQFALSLSNGETYRIGGGYPVGINLVSPDEIQSQSWSGNQEYAHLIGKQIAGVYGTYGDSEPYVVFTDGTVIHVTGEECGDIVVIDTLTELRRHSSWAVDMWKPIPGVN